MRFASRPPVRNATNQAPPREHRHGNRRSAAQGPRRQRLPACRLGPGRGRGDRPAPDRRQPGRPRFPRRDPDSSVPQTFATGWRARQPQGQHHAGRWCFDRGRRPAGLRPGGRQAGDRARHRAGAGARRRRGRPAQRLAHRPDRRLGRAGGGRRHALAALRQHLGRRHPGRPLRRQRPAAFRQPDRDGRAAHRSGADHPRHVDRDHRRRQGPGRPEQGRARARGLPDRRRRAADPRSRRPVRRPARRATHGRRPQGLRPLDLLRGPGRRPDRRRQQPSRQPGRRSGGQQHALDPDRPRAHGGHGERSRPTSRASKAGSRRRRPPAPVARSCSRASPSAGSRPDVWPKACRSMPTRWVSCARPPARSASPTPRSRPASRRSERRSAQPGP